MTTSTPSVSLLIPCYNHARFLPALFASIRAQALPYSEILLWDDGSSDDSAAVARSLGAQVFTGPQNLGPAEARNALARLAQSAWIHFHDADDLLDPAYNRQMFAQIAPAVDVVFCDADWIDETGRTLIPWRYSQPAAQRDPVGYFLTHPMGINNCIYRRDLFERANGFDARLVPWEDADFHVRLAEIEARFLHCPEVLTRSVRHDGGISVEPHRNWRARLLALQGYYERMAPTHRPLIGQAAEEAARELAALRDSRAQDALQLCRTCGLNPPSGSGLALRMSRRFLPPLVALRWQAKRRRTARGG